MNFLKHPIFALYGLGLCGWLSYANVRGMSPLMAVSPSSWFSSSNSGGHSGMSHGGHSFGGGGFHHK